MILLVIFNKVGKLYFWFVLIYFGLCVWSNTVAFDNFSLLVIFFWTISIKFGQFWSSLILFLPQSDLHNELMETWFRSDYLEHSNSALIPVNSFFMLENWPVGRFWPGYPPPGQIYFVQHTDYEILLRSSFTRDTAMKASLNSHSSTENRV